MMRRRGFKGVAIVSIFIFVTLSFSFVSGVFDNETVLEQSADYTAHVVKNQTDNQTYCAIAVDSNEESGPLADPFSEFHKLYGIFKQTKATFGSLHNFHKDDSVFYSELGENENLSMFYLGAVGIEEVDGVYRHNMYPFEVMFKDAAHYDVSRYLAFISQSQADNILKQRGVLKTNGKYTEDDYNSIYATPIPITINGITTDFVIDNIYFERGYYYDCISEIAGEFFLTSYYLPVSIPRTNVYLLSGYSFQNSYFMKYINDVYSNKLFDLTVGKRNIKGEINEGRILNFYYGTLKNSLSFLTYLLVFFAAFCFIFSFVIFYKYKISFSLPNILLLACAIVTPYCLFKLAYIITKEVSVFSTFGARMNLILSTCFIVGFIIFYFLSKNSSNTAKGHKINYEELYI